MKLQGIVGVLLVALLACSSPDTPDQTVIARASLVSTTWSSPLGGNGDDVARDAVVDSQGNLYVTGGAGSNNFPTTVGAFSRTHNNTANGTAKPMDVFITKFSPTGQILASTFVGGPGYDRAYAIEIDPQGNIVIAGRAGRGFPTTGGSAQPVFAGGTPGSAYGTQDAFACKFTADLSTRLWCTYIGTSGDDIARDMDVDDQGDVYLTGHTTGVFPPGYINGYTTTRAAGQDGYVMKISGDGSHIVWGTYWGGAGSDGVGPSVRWSPTGVWMIGGTDAASTKLPTTPTAVRHSPAGSFDLYLAEFTTDGSQLLYGSYIGGSLNDATETHDLAVNKITGDVYVAAGTNSANFPVTPDAVQRTLAGTNDGFLMRFDAAGNLLYSTYIGTAAQDAIQGLSVGPDGTVYLSGQGMNSYDNQPVVGPGGGTADANMLVYASDAKTLQFGRRIGGTLADYGRGVGFGPSGELYLVGQTYSSNFPRIGSFTRPYGGGGYDGFVSRLR